MNLGQMRAKARILLDESSAVFWSDDEINWYVNIAYKQYYQHLVFSDFNRLRTTGLLSIVSGTETIALPTGCLSAAMLERVFDTKTIPLEYKERFEAPNLTSGADTSYYLPTWTVRGANIVLEPTPSASFSNGLKIHYYPEPTEMTVDANTPDAGFISTWHDMLPVKAAILAKEGRQESDTAGLQSFLNQLEEPFVSITENLVTSRQYSAPFITGGENF